ncbi:MAG: aminotransferase class III-fold pyridoxal phosphate-dependent enzyme [candidate division KSB1 bacterium]|nr:aminotransferase class III-fold pyridoxal phosphate-dependent enzyme [candidate division KSB1 bacterium]MDZ7276326.1 aminotransferase class III-fold pyridoxal phosphate-dependent enzyme [candidate division KSB1 bacterium]MDZ7287721.1 aminotransferase class III-fold pyridoxal phosphate-dependent enzyme [candidate division KSB1 bacterium]MDZ7299939.1 aminotransferase class III-fold pyridoxal phosphate-dependent enzyme [candidate division KSB1 bacterium]MDZ7305732.1 aminotransferase class III-f
MTPKHAEHYARALARMPWATQTNAKRWRPEYGDFMPPFIKRAQGCRLWDLDDREYLDFRCALGPIILGYCYPEVETAVRAQMENGVLFSMASPLEWEAAEAVCQNVPWVEQIRFMKTGADACTACVRLARAHTGREHILTCGYHGYHDWSALRWPNPGVPRVLNEYVHEIKYGDCAAALKVFDQHGHELAGVITVPYDWNEDTGGEFLALLRQKCDQYGAWLIFDEVLTGFRLARGGAQEYYGITPDLAAFAKALANGYPLSAFAGKREYMQTLEQTIITTTYAGETLSLAACTATMAVMRTRPVHEHLNQMGRRLRDGFQEIIQETGLPAHAAGVAPAPFLQFAGVSEQEKLQWQNRLFAQLFKRGIFPSERWFITFSHQPADIEQALEKVRDAARAIC